MTLSAGILPDDRNLLVEGVKVSRRQAISGTACAAAIVILCSHIGNRELPTRKVFRPGPSMSFF
jgi:hypothetical protein